MEYLLHILVITGIYIILTLSLNLILGYTGLPAFGHMVFSCVGAYTSSLLAVDILRPRRLQVPRFWVLAPSLLALCAVTVVAVIVPLRLGLKHLEELKD